MFSNQIVEITPIMVAFFYFRYGRKNFKIKKL